MRRAVLVIGLLWLVVNVLVRAQSSPLQFMQATDSSAPVPLNASERAQLGDPMFNLVLRNHANVVTLSGVQGLIQPNVANRELFVVSEAIVNTAQSGGRRAVLAFNGENGSEKLSGNVMLSVSFGPSGFQDHVDIEAWGWDNHRERYNYYKLDRSSAGGRTWKFRGSSERADLLEPKERAGTCLRCHVVGAPVMKELLFPWNNWHAGVGGSFKADYLDPNSASTAKWPAATTAGFRQLSTADRLETLFLMPAFRRFDAARLNQTLKRDDATGNREVLANGHMMVMEGRRLLRSLFRTVEVNLISSRNTSGIHPLGSASDFVPTLDIQIPNSFFLNVNLIAGGGAVGVGGLKITDANQFASIAKLTQQENKNLVEKFKLRLDGRRGDAHFGWLVPEVGFVDYDVIDQALKLGVVSPHFVAAALAIDLETPVFSTRRAELLDLLPDRYEFVPLTAEPDAFAPRDASKDFLTQAVLT